MPLPPFRLILRLVLALLARAADRFGGPGPTGLVALLLLAATAAAQPATQPAPAALRQRLTTATDTSRVRLLLQLADGQLYTQFDSAWAYARAAQTLAQQLHFADGQYRAAGQLGILYGIRGNHEASLRMFLAQLRLNQQRPDSARYRPGILSNIANSYYSQGKYAAAVGLLAQARRGDAAAHDTAGLITDLNNLNQLFIKQRQLGQALHASQEATRLARRYQHGQLGQAYLYLVSVLHELGRYTAARDTCLALLPALHRENQGQPLAYAYHLLLRDYQALHQQTAAEQAGQLALRYARPAGMLDVERDVLLTLSEVSAQAGDYAAAYRQQRRADSLTTHLTRESNAKTVEDMQFKYDTERREAQVLDLHQRVRSSRWQAGLGGALALAALLAAAMLLRAKRLQTEVFRQRELLREETAARERQAEAARHALEANQRRQLELELAGSQREQASAALFAQQKTKLLEDLTARLDALGRRVPESQRELVADLKKTIRQHLSVAEDWERVTLHFEKIHPDFFAQLLQQHPGLTPGELKQCAYVKLNLTNKDIANLLNIEASSVKISHYRIKKKMGLADSESLRDYIVSV